MRDRIPPEELPPHRCEETPERCPLFHSADLHSVKALLVSAWLRGGGFGAYTTQQGERPRLTWRDDRNEVTFYFDTRPTEHGPWPDWDRIIHIHVISVLEAKRRDREYYEEHRDEILRDRYWDQKIEEAKERGWRRF